MRHILIADLIAGIAALQSFGTAAQAQDILRPGRKISVT